jgi:tripartite-type tricarboxylate transporter receptor subunit TctC
MAPANTPKAIVERLNSEITRAVNAPETRQSWQAQGAVPMSMSPEEFGKFLRDDIEKWAHVVKVSGAKSDR